MTTTPTPVNPSPIAAVLQWVWDNFAKSALEKGVKWTWTKVQWEDAARRYHERVAEDYGKLFVLGKPEPRPIDDIYTYINVLEKVTAFERYAPEQLHALFLERRGFHRQAERRDGFDLVRSGDNLFVLGKPGAGKTTFLKQLAISSAGGKLERGVEKQWVEYLPEAVQRGLEKEKTVTMMPVFVGLKDHADSGRSLLESVVHELKVCRFPDAPAFVRALLHSGRALVLWDGLDEVREEGNGRSTLIGQMHAFMREFRETQFVITCRVAAADYSFDNVRYVEMADFDEDQMERFVKRWFGWNDQGRACWEALKQNENKGLRELAQVPLLLTLLCINYEETLTFPRRRVEIYEEALDALLRTWDTKRRIKRDEVYKKLSLGRKRQMFARIAAENFEKGQFVVARRVLEGQIEAYLATVPGVEGEVDGHVVLQAIMAQHGIFVERSKNLISYAHLTFQEYYTAKYIADNRRFEQLFTHAGEDQWREVFLLSASLLDEADPFFTAFAEWLTTVAGRNQALQLLLRSAMTIVALSAARLANAGTPAFLPVALRAYVFARDRARALDHARALALARDRDLDLDLARDLDRARARAHALARGLDLDLVRALDLDRDFDRARDRDLARDLDRARARARDLDRALARALDLDRALDLARDLARGLARDRALFRALARSPARALDLDRALARDPALARDLARDLAALWPERRDMTELADQLRVLNVPSLSDDDQMWQKYAETTGSIHARFRAICSLDVIDTLVDDSDIGVLGSLTEEDLDAMVAYFKGTALLIDCLELATVSDRRAIEEMLLQPADEG